MRREQLTDETRSAEGRRTSESADAQSETVRRWPGVQCEAFRRNPDDSWSSIRVTDVPSPLGAIRIPGGMEFRRGRTLCGVDVAGLLDEQCV